MYLIITFQKWPVSDVEMEAETFGVCEQLGFWLVKKFSVNTLKEHFHKKCLLSFKMFQPKTGRGGGQREEGGGIPPEECFFPPNNKSVLD